MSHRPKNKKLTEINLKFLETEDLRKLTPARLTLLDLIYNQKKRRNVTQLADHLDRDKKHISKDLRLLERFGLVLMRRRGRQVMPYALGNELVIRLGAHPESVPRRAKLRGRRPPTKRKRTPVARSG